VTDLGQVPHTEMLRYYAGARALFFASYAESYGIPLLEAQSAGLPIIAAELDFVRDICVPVESFDPCSPVSMARAVKRFLNLGSEVIKPLTPEQFIQELIVIGSSDKEISTGK
jgi:glycosyltransferase involved in cell wall biosynthesis